MTKLQAWRLSKARADLYQPHVEKIIRRMAGDIISVRVATDDEDQHHATDMVFEVTGGTVAVRVRETSHRDLTIRSKRDTGARTELDKFRDGDHARWYVYVWVRLGRVDEWIFVDNDILASCKILECKPDIPNGDGTYFRAVPIHELDTAGCLIHHAARKAA